MDKLLKALDAALLDKAVHPRVKDQVSELLSKIESLSRQGGNDMAPMNTPLKDQKVGIKKGL